MVELNEKQNVKKEALLVSQIRYTAQMTTMLEVVSLTARQECIKTYLRTAQWPRFMI